MKFWYNFVSLKFKDFCRKPDIEQELSSSDHHQSNGQVETCIKFAKQTMKIYLIIMLMSIWLY